MVGGPARGNKLGSARGELNDEIDFAAFEALLEDGDGLTNERVMRRRDADLLAVSVIQPRSMLAVVIVATAAAR